jgi:hypothetical protein
MDPRHGDNTFRVVGDAPFEGRFLQEVVGELHSAGLPRGAIRVTMREVESRKRGTCIEQMARCGIVVPSAVVQAPMEWVEAFDVTAQAYGWKLDRRWYYWECNAKYPRFAIPIDAALRLHAELGTQARANGDCACREPTDAVDTYHVDTPEGLQALVSILKRRFP